MHRRLASRVRALQTRCRVPRAVGSHARGLAHKLDGCGRAGAFPSENSVERQACAAAFGVVEGVASQFKRADARWDGADAMAV